MRAAVSGGGLLVERFDAVKFGIFQRNLSNFRGLVLFCTSYGARPQARAVNLSLALKIVKFHRADTLTHVRISLMAADMPAHVDASSTTLLKEVLAIKELNVQQ